MKSKYINETSELITQDGMNNSSAKLLPIGTILYSIIANIGTTAFLNIEACTNQGIAGLFFDDSLNKEFIYYFLKNSATYMMKQSHGTAYNSINSKNLRNMFIPFPPIEEQQRIVAKIKQLEPLIDKYEELIKQRNILDENLAKK
ncbi:restriction endonuclease subunit S [bacterium]|nr:restriction endonuclease subunit S [bacterium]